MDIPLKSQKNVTPFLWKWNSDQIKSENNQCSWLYLTLERLNLQNNMKTLSFAFFSWEHCPNKGSINCNENLCKYWSDIFVNSGLLEQEYS